MVTEKLEQLQGLRAKVAELEQAIEATRNTELAALPARYGFAGVREFVAAVKAATGEPRGHRGRPRGKSKSAGAKGGRRRRKRATITDETRAQVKKLVEGRKTGSEIAKALGISLPSVQNIKKALGLVKSTKK